MFDVISFIPRAVVQGIPLLLGSTGETLTEKSGNLNLGIPGIMYVGAISGVIGSFFYEQSAGAAFRPLPGILIPLVCCLVGSLLMGLLYCFLTVTLRANQNVTGLALTTFGVGFGNFFGGSLIKLSGSELPSIILSSTSYAFRSSLPAAEKLGAFGKLFLSYGFLAYLAVVIALVASYILKRTRLGLHLRAVGESPTTADAAGINVARHKVVEQRLRRPRLARDRAGHLHGLAAERRRAGLLPLRRTVYRAHVHPLGHEPRRQGAVQDGSLRRHDHRAGAHLDAQQAREPAARLAGPALFPRGTIGTYSAFPAFAAEKSPGAAAPGQASGLDFVSLAC